MKKKRIYGPNSFEGMRRRLSAHLRQTGDISSMTPAQQNHADLERIKNSRRAEKEGKKP